MAGYRVRERLARLPAQSDAVGGTGAVTGSVTLSDVGGRLQADSVGTATGAASKVSITGKLTIHGVTREVIGLRHVAP